MKKEGSLSLHVQYAMMLIIFAVVLVFGYMVAKSSSSDAENTELLLFREQLTSDIDTLTSGDVRVKSYVVPNDIDKVCFTCPGCWELDPSCPDAGDHPLIKDAVLDNSQDNFFIVGESQFSSTRIDDVSLPVCKFQCMPTSVGRVELRLEGAGEVTFVGPP